MTRTTPRRLRRSGKTSIALVTAAVALAGGVQALAPTPASAYNDGAGCTTDKWGFIVCEAPQTGNEGWPWEDGPGSTKGSGNGGDAPSNVNDGNGYDDGNGHEPPPPTPSPFNPAPHRSKPSRPSYADDDDGPKRLGETDDDLDRRFQRQNCRRTRTAYQHYLAIKQMGGFDWFEKFFSRRLGETPDDVLDRLADDYGGNRCLKAVGPLLGG
jgi:hypothetical protein